MPEIIKDKIVVDGKIVGSVHEYIENTRRLDLTFVQREKRNKGVN